MVRCHVCVAEGSVPADMSTALASVAVERGTDGDHHAVVVVLGGDIERSIAVLEDAYQEAPGRVLALARPEGRACPTTAWTLLEHGASDVAVWRGPESAVDIEARLARWAEIDALVDSPQVSGRALGDSTKWRAILRHVVEVARFTQASVLLIGESGTGKELLARAVHEVDGRPRKGAFVVVDCTTVVPTLSGSEFFGHERGAFTGAVAARDGAFALADGGTLFLDEVGELPLQLQAELLRVVQEGTYKRVGSNVWHTTSFRLVCATNRDLEVEESEGRFRRDLYFRLAGAVIRLPPLRERPQDVLPLFRTFLRAELGHEPEIDPAVVELLLARSWPGNVRELRQLATRVANRNVGRGPVTVGGVPEDERPVATGIPRWPDGAFETGVRRALALGHGLHEIPQLAADAAVQVALADSGGHVATAARLLGVTTRAVQLRLQNRSGASSG